MRGAPLCLTMFWLVPILPGQTQQSTQLKPAYVVRITSEALALQTMQRYCLLVLPTGDYHMERVYQAFANSLPSTKVFQGKLSGVEMAELRNLLEQKDFVQLSTANLTGFRVMRDQEVLTISTFRGDHYQKLLLDPDRQQKFRAQLRPIHKWLTEFRHRKLMEDKSVPPTACRTPEMIKAFEAIP